MTYWDENGNQYPRAAVKMIKVYRGALKFTKKLDTGNIGPQVFTTSMQTLRN